MDNSKSPLKVTYLENDFLEIKIRIEDSKLIGKKAKLEVHRCVDVLIDRGNDKAKILYKAKFTTKNQERILKKKLKLESYSGKKIKVYHKVILKIDDSIIFDSKFEASIENNQIKDKNISSKRSQNIIDPKDRYKFIKNFKSLSPKNQLLIIALCAGCICFSITNTITGIHDQFSLESMTWIYSQYDSDGSSSSPLKTSLFITGSIMLATWAYIKVVLRRYMTFRNKKIMAKVSANTNILARDLIGGISKVELRDVTVRVVAGNFENGSYEVGSGSSQRTVWFKDSINGVVLYEERVMFIPPGVSISNYLEGEIFFYKVFQILHPKLMTNKSGIDTYWEIQLIHNDLVDQEISMENTKFNLTDFKRVA